MLVLLCVGISVISLGVAIVFMLFDVSGISISISCGYVLVCGVC